MESRTPLAVQGSQLHGPLGRLLRPLVRLFISTGITFPLLSDLLRELYVNVAENDFALAGKEQTDSRVSLLTGIHRKEVRRLRGAGAPVSAIPSSLSGSSRILARWLGSESFSTSDGPMALPRTAGEGDASFEALVQSVTRDVRPRAVLDEWLNRGLVEIDAEDRIVLRETALIPASGEEQQLYYFGRNLHDHIAAAVTNITAPKPRFLERAVHYDHLSRESVEKLEALSRELASNALQKANREALRLSDEAPDGAWRWNFGLYVYAEEDASPGKSSGAGQ